MVEIAKRYQDQLKRIKEMVEESRTYFKDNCDLFHKSREFVFKTSLTPSVKAVLSETQKPMIECNIMEAFISRLRGEFSKQQPSISVSGAGGQTTDPALIQFLEDHFRWCLYEANNDGFEYKVYTDQLSGGFGVMKLCTDWENDKSFDQMIRISAVDDPTLCGFDPLARKPHKGDGRYWYHLYPKTKEEFETEYPDVDISRVKFESHSEPFSWAYSTNTDKIIVCCDYFEKKKKKAKLLKLANGQVMLADDYQKLQDEWNNQIASGMMLVQPPMIVDQRSTMITTVCHYIFIANQVIDYEETDYCGLNGVFVDGNSVYLRAGEEGANKQMTRPYCYHAFGTQKLKNFAMQSLANELENMVQHKWMIPKEGIVMEQSKALTNNQIPNVLVYNAYRNMDPNTPLPPPEAIARPPIPPEITNTFQLCDQAMQMVLGSYDASLGINDNQLSGIAIVEAATQSNAAAMPYIVGFLQGLNQIAQIYLDLVPKYYKTPRTLPVMDIQGKRGWKEVNNPNGQGVQLNYDSTNLHVRVEAGVNFAIQKSKALQQIIALSQASQVFGEFINTQGLDILLDNMEIRGIDQLTDRAQMFMQQLQKQQAQATQQPNPLMVKAQLEQAKLAQSAQADQRDFQLRAAELRNDANANENDRLQIILEAEAQKRDDVVQMAKANAEMDKAKLDSTLKVHEHALKATDQIHRHAHDTAQFHHQVEQANKPTTTGETQHGES